MTEHYRANQVNVSMRTRAKTFKFPLEAVRVERGGHLHISKASRLVSGNGLAALYCDGSTTLTIGAGLCGLWCPLKGEVQFAEAGSRFAVPKRFIYVSDSNRPYEVEVPTHGACIAIIGSQITWSAVNGFGADNQGDAPAIFPALHPAASATRRSIIAFARECLDNAPRPSSSRHISILSSLLGRLQQSFEDLIQACPGRTIARRRSVFLRMQRTRMYIELYNSMDLDVSMLAHIANYSLGQFIKIFRQVFGETPHTYLARCRIEVAKMLLKSKTMMGVSDVARAAGFASRSSFTRNMKQISGSSATELRESIIG
jgi:AraC family transcriptional regulator